MKAIRAEFRGDNLVITYESAEAEDTNGEFEDIIPLPPRVSASGATVFGPASSPESWTELDLSSVVGENTALVILSVSAATTMDAVAVRRNGDTDEYQNTGDDSAFGCASGFYNATDAALVLICVTDAAGVIEWITESSQTATVKLIAYIK